MLEISSNDNSITVTGQHSHPVPCVATIMTVIPVIMLRLIFPGLIMPAMIAVIAGMTTVTLITFTVFVTMTATMIITIFTIIMIGTMVG